MKRHKNVPMGNSETSFPVRLVSFKFLAIVMSSKEVKTLDAFTLGGRMECVSPNLRMSRCSNMRL